MKINNNEYIYKFKFTKEEVEQFCQLALDSGHGRGEWLYFYSSFKWLGVNANGIHWGDHCRNERTDITAKYKQYLQEKNMQTFSKNDLKDGMVVTLRKGDIRYILQDKTWDVGEYSASCAATLDRYKDDLTWNGAFSEGYPHNDIVRVVDRDDTVVYVRKEEPTELTLEQVAEKFGLDVGQVRIKK